MGYGSCVLAQEERDTGRGRNRPDGDCCSVRFVLFVAAAMNRAVVSVRREDSFPYVTRAPIYYRIGIKNDEEAPTPAERVVVTLLTVEPDPGWRINPLLPASDTRVAIAW